MTNEPHAEPISFEVTAPAGGTQARLYRAPTAEAPCLVLAHGAGAGQGHPFMTATARALSTRGIDVVTFDFLYMAAKRRSPDRAPVLEATWCAVVDEVRRRDLPRSRVLVLGGKSMGGRIASMVLAADGITGAAGLVLLGYPLHPPGQPGNARIAHLPSLRTPTLVVQGSRDEFGREDEVRPAFDVVPAHVDWHIVAGGDHSFRVPKSAGVAQADVLAAISDRVATWVLGRR